MATKEAAQANAAAESGKLWLSLWTVCVMLVLAAIGISGYLIYAQVSDTSVACVDTGKFNCDAVHGSTYSKLFGVPIAYLGFATNIGLLALLLLENRIPFLQANGIALFFGIVLFGFLYSVYLVYLQAFVIESYCQWCLAHEALYAVLFVVSGLRLRQVISFE